MKPVSTTVRRERLAAQLRENLKKRKAQARARRETGEADKPAGEPAAGLAPAKPVG